MVLQYEHTEKESPREGNRNVRGLEVITFRKKAEGTGTEKTEGKMIVSTKYSQGCLKGNAMFFYTHAYKKQGKVQDRHQKSLKNSLSPPILESSQSPYS